MSQPEHVHDLIGVGFGPSNLALAVRLALFGREDRPDLPFTFKISLRLVSITR